MKREVADWLVVVACVIIIITVALIWATAGRSAGQGHYRHYSHPRTHYRYHRSRHARSSFMRQHPCPSTGKARGACRGYVVDHVKPLACGGADAPSNMQWQMAAAGKAKDKRELICQ